MYGPNFTNPMNQSGQFMSEINRLNNHKEAKQMKDLNTHMENQAVPFFPPPHQPKLSAESQEKYAAGNKTVEETIDRYTQVAESRKAKEETIRGQILDTAKGLTTGDRNKSYGPPIDNLTTYANLCTAYIFGKGGNDNELLALDAVDAAVLMVLAKVSRIAANRGHKDNYVDGAAYMAIAGECDELLESPPPTKSRCRENYCSRTLRGWVMESINPWFDPKYDPTYGYGRPFGPREGDNDYIKDQPNNYTRFA